MNAIRKQRDILPMQLGNCHNGEGVLLCRSMLDGLESEKIPFMHVDEMPAGVSIGEHAHTGNEEVYYLQSGKGILTYDGKQYEMNAGDISLCKIGHSHGFMATDNCYLVVVASF